MDNVENKEKMVDSGTKEKFNSIYQTTFDVLTLTIRDIAYQNLSHEDKIKYIKSINEMLLKRGYFSNEQDIKSLTLLIQKIVKITDLTMDEKIKIVKTITYYKTHKLGETE